MNIKKNILLVEDELVISLNLKQQLERDFNYMVTIVNTGEKALDKISDFVDIVLMDISLGAGMNGIETANKILEVMDLPIIFVSNHIDAEMMNKIEKISYGYMPKNIDILILNSAIKIALKLFNTQQKTNDVFENSINGICVFKAIYDDNYNIVDCEHLKFNKPYEKHAGITQDAVGKTILEIFSNNAEFLDLIPTFVKVMRNQKPINLHWQYKKSGSWYDLSIFPTRNHSQFAVIVENITEKKNIECL